MSENHLAAAMRFCSRSDCHFAWHRYDLSAASDRARKEFDRVGATLHVFNHIALSFARGARGLELCQVSSGRIEADIERNSFRRIERPTDSQNTRTRDLARIDPSPKIARVAEIRCQVEDGRKAKSREHVAKLPFQLGSGQRFRSLPLRRGEMDVRVLKTGGQSQAGGVADSRPRRQMDFSCLPDRNNYVAFDEDGSIRKRLRTRAWVDTGMHDGRAASTAGGRFAVSVCSEKNTHCRE